MRCYNCFSGVEVMKN